ncbi:hypothetical protein [Streptomyces abikoensis]|uniref:hypothetical protein n=1 Tax=Streptomyces abikoensis TaxID=97398 RepID=UPI0036BFF44D
MARPHPAVTTATDRRATATTTCALAGVAAGVVLAVVWSARLVDGLGVDTADGLLGRDSLKDDIPGGGAGVVFAFVVGLAGTFTACNVAAFGALAPMAGTGDTAGTRGGRLAAALRPRHGHGPAAVRHLHRRLLGHPPAGPLRLVVVPVDALERELKPSRHG